MGLQIRTARGRRGRDEAERFRLAALDREDGIYDHDLVKDRAWWNDTYDRLFGPRAPASEASAEWWRERLHPEDRARVLGSLQHALAGAEDRWSCAYRLIRPDGDIRSVLDRATIRRDGAGNATRMLGSILDLTEHDRALETERKARAEAERASRMKDD